MEEEEVNAAPLPEENISEPAPEVTDETRPTAPAVEPTPPASQPVNQSAVSPQYSQALYNKIRAEFILSGKKVFSVAQDDYKGLILNRYLSGVSSTLTDNPAVTVFENLEIEPGNQITL